MFDFSFLMDMGNYEQRKVLRTEPEDNNGIGVDTAFTSDEGYETALLTEDDVVPVERYKTKKLAIAGHKRWVEKSKTLKKVKKLGWSDTPELDEIVTLKRFDSLKVKGKDSH